MSGRTDRNTSLHSAIGGEPVLAAAVDEFYARVLANPRLAAFFAHTTLDELKMHQRAFLAMALGGPELYTGRTMHDAHAGRGITDADFDRLLVHLVDSLAALDISEPIVEQVIANLEPFRAEIVMDVAAPDGA